MTVYYLLAGLDVLGRRKDEIQRGPEMTTFNCHADKLLGALQAMGPARGYTYVIVLLRIYEVKGPTADTAEELARRTGLPLDVTEKALAWLLEKKKLFRAACGGLMNAVAEREISANLIDIERSQESVVLNGLSVKRPKALSGGRVGQGAVKPYHSVSVKKQSTSKKRRSSIEAPTLGLGGSGEGTTGKTRKASDWPADAFKRFWDIVPRRVAKAAALRAFERIRKRGDVPWSIFHSGALRWQKDAAGKEFVKHPATWLNGGCWDDEPAPVVTGKANGRPSIWDVARGGQPLEQDHDARPDVEIFAPGEAIPGTRHH